MRTKLKKLISVCLAVIMILSVLTFAVFTASADEDKPIVYTSGNFEYAILDDGTITINRYNGNESDLTVPSTLDGYTVTSFGRAFENCTNLENITIPDSVSSISWHAFDNTAWYNNQPDGVVYAGKVVYKYKGQMPDNTSIILKDGRKGIAADAFLGCSNLVSIVIPKTVTNIGFNAFYHCESLTDITIPDSVTYIEIYAFTNCINLKSVVIPATITDISSKSFGYYSYDNKLFKKIDGFTIYGYTGTAAETYAKENGVTFIALDESDSDFEYELLDDGTAEITGYNGSAIELIIPSEIDGYAITKIGDGAFFRNTNLTNITIPNGVITIGGWAFEYCTSLTSITIPGSVTRIGNSAFYDCENLKSIVIPKSVTSIEDYTFELCKSLESIVIP